MPQSTVLLEMAEALFESAERGASFENEAMEEDAMSKVSSNGLSGALLRNSLPDSANSREKTTLDVSFELLWYQICDR